VTTTANPTPDATPVRKPLTKAHKAKLAAALNRWRAGLTDKDKEELKERNKAAHKTRWANMSKRERDERLAGVRAWQAEQRAAKAAAEKAAKAAAKPKPKAGAKTAPPKAARRSEVSEKLARARTVEVVGPDGTSKPSARNNVLANSKARKAAQS
jgi:hypothetical protein